MSDGVLDVAERGAFIERERNGAAPQRAGVADPLAEALGDRSGSPLTRMAAITSSTALLSGAGVCV